VVDAQFNAVELRRSLGSRKPEAHAADPGAGDSAGARAERSLEDRGSPELDALAWLDKWSVGSKLNLFDDGPDGDLDVPPPPSAGYNTPRTMPQPAAAASGTAPARRAPTATSQGPTATSQSPPKGPQFRPPKPKKGSPSKASTAKDSSRDTAKDPALRLGPRPRPAAVVTAKPAASDDQAAATAAATADARSAAASFSELKEDSE